MWRPGQCDGRCERSTHVSLSVRLFRPERLVDKNVLRAAQLQSLYGAQPRVEVPAARDLSKVGDILKESSH